MSDTGILASLRAIEDIAVEMVEVIRKAGMPVAASAYARALATQITAIRLADPTPPATRGPDHA